MYMPLMLDLKSVVVFGGERGEGLQKVHKLAHFADSLLVVPEAGDVPGCSDGTRVIRVPAGQSPLVGETMVLGTELLVPVYERCAAGLSDQELEFLVKGRSFVCSDLSDRSLNERIFRVARTWGVPCNVIDTKDLCTVWFMSLIQTPNLLAGISSRGKAAVLAQEVRKSLEPAVEALDGVAGIIVDLKASLPEGYRLAHTGKLFRALAWRSRFFGIHRARAWGQSNLARFLAPSGVQRSSS